MIEIGRTRSTGLENFGHTWTRRMGGFQSWTIFMDVICVLSLMHFTITSCSKITNRTKEHFQVITKFESVYSNVFVSKYFKLHQIFWCLSGIKSEHSQRIGWSFMVLLLDKFFNIGWGYLIIYLVRKQNLPKDLTFLTR